MNTGVETTPDTLFQIGSITKVFTTTMIMQLVDEGRVELDAPAVTYLPELRFSDDAITRAVTIRQLLTHTSGVDGDFFDDHGRGDDCVAQYVAACAGLPQMFSPGTMWSYCNAGFVVLGRIIEVLTGAGWDAALRSRILEPLDMREMVTLPEEALRFRTAAGHAFDAELNMQLSPRWSMARSAGPAGATPCASVGDLLKFARMHIDGGISADGKRVLSEASVQAMQQPQFDLPYMPGEGNAHWGLGWMIFDWGGRRVIGHDGGTIGQNSSLRVLPEERFAAAVFTNTSPSGGMLTHRAMYWLFGQCLGIEMPERPRPPESPPSFHLAPYAGTYERTSIRFRVTEMDGKLQMQAENTGPLAALNPTMPPSDLYPVEPGLFLERNPWLGVFQPVRFIDEGGVPAYVFASYRLNRRVS
jgi:CubicO group peptidase (beta-lactamase class C family)